MNKRIDALLITQQYISKPYNKCFNNYILEY